MILPDRGRSRSARYTPAVRKEPVIDITAIPKVEHHCHLEACFRRETVLEVGPALGLEVPADPEVFRREWLITEPVANLEQALAK